mmetsp:Transcript_14563/g.39996  ORF Transcript_14563/g.39996 Transcript_14563/m.39996 type:complete len:212 (+) Transcript_14563:291-926(+)
MGNPPKLRDLLLGDADAVEGRRAMGAVHAIPNSSVFQCKFKLGQALAIGEGIPKYFRGVHILVGLHRLVAYKPHVLRDNPVHTLRRHSMLQQPDHALHGCPARTQDRMRGVAGGDQWELLWCDHQRIRRDVKGSLAHADGHGTQIRVYDLAAHDDVPRPIRVHDRRQRLPAVEHGLREVPHAAPLEEPLHDRPTVVEDLVSANNVWRVQWP